MVSGADVFLTNVRPAALTRIGLDFEAVVGAQSAPGVRLDHRVRRNADPTPTAPPTTSPRSGRGPAWRTCSPDPVTRPPFQRGGMGDHAAGMTLAGAVCAALVARDRTGEGQLVSTSLYRQGAYTVSFDLNTFLLTGPSDRDRSARDRWATRA